MKRTVITWGLALLFAGLPLTTCYAQQTSIQGDWIGQIDYGKQWQRINFHFVNEKENLKGTLDLPQQGRNGLPLKNIVLESSRVRIEWEGRSGLGTYEGHVTDNTIAGEFRQGDLKGTFRVIQVANATADLNLYNEYAGSYQLGPDRFVDLAPFSEDEDRPIFFDSKTRRTGVLYALSETEFFSGTSYGVMFPIDVRVTFVRSNEGQVTGLKWQENGSKIVQARRVSPYQKEEITFQNGEATLRGTLTMPATKGPHPAIILVHGSGPQRRPSGHWTHYFTRHGIAYFYFDKRGSGASTGDLHSASLNDLAGDVLAAVQALRGNKHINPNQIGLIGHSNGGWVAPLAASQSKDVAFVIVKSGSALPVHENILYELEMDMRAAGNFSEDDIAHARAIRQQLNKALLTNTGWEALSAVIAKSKNEPWFGYARVQWLAYVPPPLDSTANSVLSGFRRQIDFAPAKTWEQVQCPVLVLLGELDANVPSKVSSAIMERGLKSGGNKDYSVRILANANHGLFEAETGFSSESPRLKRYVPGYMAGITDWLMKRVVVKKY